MMEPIGRLRLFPSLVVTLVTCGLASGLLLAEGRRDYPDLHTPSRDVAATVERMREFYRQREPQLTLAPADGGLFQSAG
jgi:hypothetical protein